MKADDQDQQAVRFALSELDRYAYAAEPLGPERLLELLVHGPKTREDGRILAVILQSSRSPEHLQQLVGLGAVPGPALVRTVRSLAVAHALRTKRVSGLHRDALVGFVEELRDAADRCDNQRDVTTTPPLPRKRGRPAASPESGPQTDAERQRARAKRLRARGFRKKAYWLSPEALAALNALRSAAAPGTKVEDIVSAALMRAARDVLGIEAAVLQTFD